MTVKTGLVRENSIHCLLFSQKKTRFQYTDQFADSYLSAFFISNASTEKDIRHIACVSHHQGRSPDWAYRKQGNPEDHP